MEGSLGGGCSLGRGCSEGSGALRCLSRGKGGSDAPERRELAEPGGASAALRGVGAARGAELRKPPWPAGGVSRTRARRPEVAPRLVGASPEFAAGGFRARCQGPGVRGGRGISRGEGWSGRSPAAGGRRKCPSNLYFSVMQTN